MLRKSLIPRIIPIGACAATIVLFTATGSAKTKGCNPCMIAFKGGQRAEQVGKLRQARDLFVTCSTATCGGLGKNCADEASELDSAIPTIVAVASDESGKPLVDVQVKVDGVPLTSRLDGLSLAVDPGVHEFSFSADNGASASEKIMIAQGERNRVVTVSLRTPARAVQTQVAASTPELPKAASDTAPEAKDEPKTAPAPPAPYPAAADKTATGSASPKERGKGLFFPMALGGVGLLAVGAGTLLNIWANGDNSVLSQCKPNCPQSSLDHIRTMYTISDVSFGVGVVAITGAVWILLPSHSSEDKPPAREASYTLDLQPNRSGAYASVKGQF
jgi:hypothetical protein